MKQKVIIIGASEFSEYVYQCMLKDNDAEVLAFAVGKDYIEKSIFDGLPVVAIEDLDSLFNMEECSVLLTIGYKRMNEGRIEMYKYCKEKGYNIYTYISQRAYIDCELNNIGEGCIIMPRAGVAPCTKIGICNVINSGSGVGHTSIVGDFNWFSGKVSTAGDVTIGSRCFFGMNSLICNNVKIADETLIGVCSYVTKDTKQGLAYMGMPAKNKKNMKSVTVIDFV